MTLYSSSRQFLVNMLAAWVIPPTAGCEYPTRARSQSLYRRRYPSKFRYILTRVDFLPKPVQIPVSAHHRTSPYWAEDASILLKVKQSAAQQKTPIKIAQKKEGI